MNAAPDRLSRVFADIDAVNAEDPVRETDAHTGEAQPRGLLYGRRMSERLAHYAPGAGECLRIAARAQHIRRWAVPRSDYPEGRQGYHRWRRRLAAYHAEVAGGIMAEHGYDEGEIARVGALLRKEGLARDPEVQCLEDVICLVFLEHYLEDFVARHRERHGETKLLHILRRTWAKMTPDGHAAAAALDLPMSVRPLLERALAEAPGSDFED